MDSEKVNNISHFLFVCFCLQVKRIFQRFLYSGRLRNSLDIRREMVCIIYQMIQLSISDCDIKTDFQNFLEDLILLQIIQTVMIFPTIAAAENCIKTLNDDNLSFWLKLFSEIMSEVEILYIVMQCTDLTVQKFNSIWKLFKLQSIV